MKLPLPLVAFALAALARPTLAAEAPLLPPVHSQTALFSQDPLTREILQRQVKDQDGGLRTAVLLPSGQTLELKSPDLAPLTGKPSLEPAAQGPEALKTHPKLLPAGRAGRRKPVKKAADQLRAIAGPGKGHDWGDAPKAAPEPAPRTPPVLDNEFLP